MKGFELSLNWFQRTSDMTEKGDADVFRHRLRAFCIDTDEYKSRLEGIYIRF